MTIVTALALMLMAGDVSEGPPAAPAASSAIVKAGSPAPAQPPAPHPASAAPELNATSKEIDPNVQVEDESLRMLARVRRVYVDVLTGGDEALQFRDMVMSSLQQAKVFLITENPDKADAVLKGAADDQVFTDYHDSEESLGIHTQNSQSNSWRSRYDGNTNARSNGLGVSDNEASHIEERKHEAFAAMRLVDKDGDVIWSSTQESLGGKYSGAAADVAARIAKQLAADYRRARALGPAPGKP